MNFLSLILVYEPPTAVREPVPLARIEDASLATMVARAAIAEAEQRAAEFANVDDIMGQVERAEVERLRCILRLLLPELKLNDLPAASPITQ